MPDIPEIELEIETTEIVATNRKLKAHWSRAHINDELVEELTEILANEINAEIDEEILRDLRDLSKYTIRKKKIRSIDDSWEVSKID